MANFEPELIELKAGDLAGANIDYYEVESFPVIYVNDSKKGELGAIALDGKIRTFPLTSLYSYNSRQLPEKEFFKLFPATRMLFETKNKQAA